MPTPRALTTGRLDQTLKGISNRLTWIEGAIKRQNRAKQPMAEHAKELAKLKGQVKLLATDFASLADRVADLEGIPDFAAPKKAQRKISQVQA